MRRQPWQTEGYRNRVMDSGVWQVGWWKGVAHQLLDYWWGGGGGSYMGATLESAGKGPATLSGEGLEGPPGEAWRQLLSVSQNLPWIIRVFWGSCRHIFVFFQGTNSDLLKKLGILGLVSVDSAIKVRREGPTWTAGFCL